MLDDFYKGKIFIIITKYDIDKLAALDKKIGHVRYPTGETVNDQFTRRILFEHPQIGIHYDDGNIYYSLASDEREEQCITIDTFLAEKELELEEAEFKNLFEK